MMPRTSAVGCSRKYGWITSLHTQASYRRILVTEGVRRQRLELAI